MKRIFLTQVGTTFAHLGVAIVATYVGVIGRTTEGNIGTGLFCIPPKSTSVNSDFVNTFVCVDIKLSVSITSVV